MVQSGMKKEQTQVHEIGQESVQILFGEFQLYSQIRQSLKVIRKFEE